MAGVRVLLALACAVSLWVGSTLYIDPLGIDPSASRHLRLPAPEPEPEPDPDLGVGDAPRLGETLPPLSPVPSALVSHFFRSRRTKQASRPPGPCGFGEKAKFNQLIKWRMRHDRNAIWPVLTDKYLVKQFARELGVPVPATIHVANTCKTIPPIADLPRSFALKATHTSSCNMIIEDGVVVAHRPCAVAGPWQKLGIVIKEWSLVGRQSSNDLLKQTCEKWIAHPYHHADEEWAYSELTPAIMVEEYIPDIEDVKCFHFGQGGTVVIQHVSRRFQGNRKRDTFYHRDPEGGSWSVLPGVTIDASRSDNDSSNWLPDDILRKVVDTCDAVGLGLDFARIDLLLRRSPLSNYDGHEGVLEEPQLRLGEITAYPASGNHVFRGSPNLDDVLGAAWCSS